MEDLTERLSFGFCYEADPLARCCTAAFAWSEKLSPSSGDALPREDWLHAGEAPFLAARRSNKLSFFFCGFPVRRKLFCACVPKSWHMLFELFIDGIFEASSFVALSLEELSVKVLLWGITSC